MASRTSAAKSVRLPVEVWDALARISDATGERVNDFIKAAVIERLERYDVPCDGDMQGQMHMFEDLSTDPT